MIPSIIQPLRPRPGKGWQAIPRELLNPQLLAMGYPVEAWSHPTEGLLVFSAVEVARDKDQIDRGPEYHISISRHQPRAVVRCSSIEAKWVLDLFGALGGWEEDNHVPGGQVRNFWRPVAEPMIGLECACKAAEPAIVEDKGEYVWRP